MTCVCMAKVASVGIGIGALTVGSQVRAQAAFHHLQGGRINKIVFIDEYSG